MLIGHKNNKDIYNNLLGNLLPNNIELYVEPFGGMFGLYRIMENKPKVSIYNDINANLYEKINEEYYQNRNLICFNIDYKKIINFFDSVDTFFYIDAPYYGNEHYYENHDFLKKENHIELSNLLKKIKGKFLVSYQDRELMRELYNGYNFFTYAGKNYHLKPEIAITNY